MNGDPTIVRVRTWDPGMPGAVLSLGPEGLLRVRGVDDAPSSELDIVDPAVPSSMTGYRAALAHRRLAEMVHNCFGYSSGISRSPIPFRRRVQAAYGARYSGGRMLDVGCGDPVHLTDWLAEAGEVTGIDLIDTPWVPSGVNYYTVPLSGSYPVESNDFDFAVGLFLLEHVLDLAQTLCETCRALRPGATAVWITTLWLGEQNTTAPRPCLTLSHWRDFSCLEQAKSLWIIDLETLVRQAEEAGFEVDLLLGARFGEDPELRWQELAIGERSDCQQVLLEMRKVA